MAYALLAALAAEAEQRRRGARTLLVAPTRGEGREILRALAREHGGWLGLEVTTVRPLALEMVGADLGARGLTLLDEFAEQALVDELLDEALEASPAAAHLRELAEGVGFRAAVREAVKALRLAGISSDDLRSAPLEDPAKHALVLHMLRGLEERLRTGSLADTAAVLEAATAALRDPARFPADSVLLLPGLGTRGIAGRFLRALEDRGARPLPHDRVIGFPAPSGLSWLEADAPASALGRMNDLSHAPSDPEPVTALDLFRASGITEELREVLRRILASGLRWDQAEIVTPDPGAYGPAFHALAIRLGIGVTFAVGLPVERTRPGRVVAAWLRWVRDGFPDAVLRRLLESGDLVGPTRFRDVDGAALSRRLRRLRVGWGRERYLTAIEAARRRLEAAGPRPYPEEDPEAASARHARDLHELEALHALVEPLLAAVPPIPTRVEAAPPPVTPGALARALSRFLDQVPAGGSVDDTAIERLRRILDRVSAELQRPTTFSAALAILAQHLAIRVPAPRAEGRAPWVSDGGHLHLSDVEHGGWSGREATFVVGLDAGRFPGTGAQDPILLDPERIALARHDLPTSGDRLEERRFRMAALLARLKGSVTLSYAAWEPIEGRTLTPSPQLLQVHRLIASRPSDGFEDLARRLGNPLSRIPSGAARLDVEDVWLGALAGDGRMRDGRAAVRASFSGLDAGLAAAEASVGDTIGPHHGLVAPRTRIDPRTDPSIVLSSTRLEALGTCPLRYFYQYVLGASPPEDPSFDPERWLDALRLGSLLHAVYDRTLRAASDEGISPPDPLFLERALSILTEEAEIARLEVPPPSQVVLEREMVLLVDEVRSFVDMVRRDLPTWEATELRFGWDDAGQPPVEIELPSGGRIRVRGAIDRVDRLPSDGIQVVDYKTGWPGRHSTTSVWNGGRRLQHLLYTEVAERLTGQRVDRMEYHFPTKKGENTSAGFTREELRDGLALVDRLLDVVANGLFLPTEESKDCRFCNFAAVCRVREGTYGKVDSARAAWGKAHFESEPYARFQLVRLFKDRGKRK